MPYSKTTWVDGSAPALSATNLNKIEQGIYDASLASGGGGVTTVADYTALKAISSSGRTADELRLVSKSGISGLFKWVPQQAKLVNGGILFGAFAVNDRFATDGAHGFTHRQAVYFTGDSLPPPIQANTPYYVYWDSGTMTIYEFWLTASPSDASGNWVNVTADGGGQVGSLASYVDDDDGGVRRRPTTNPSNGSWDRIFDGKELNAKWFGAVGDNIADDTTALQKAIDAHISYQLPLMIPGGQYRTTATLTSNSTFCAIKGAGGDRTALRPNRNDFDCLVLGPSGTSGGYVPNGVLWDINVVSAGTPWSTSAKKAGIKFRALPMLSVKNCRVDWYPIGFDAIDNSGGAIMENCVTRYDLVWVGLLLRPGPQSGSDWSFMNCWFHGSDAGVWIEYDTGGYHFYGGQIRAGDNKGSADDTLGAMVLGIDYDTKSVRGGVQAVELNGVSFENPHNVWCIRAHEEVFMSINDCSFNTYSSPYALGIMKVGPDAKTSHINFRGNGVQGSYANAAPLDIQSSYSTNRFVMEEDTRPRHHDALPSFNGVDLDVAHRGMVNFGTVHGGMYRGPNGLISTESPLSITATTTLKAELHETVLANATSGAITVNLPTAVGNKGKRYQVKKTDSSGNAVTVDPNGSQTIDGATTSALSTQYASVRVESDGSNWLKF